RWKKARRVVDCETSFFARFFDNSPAVADAARLVTVGEVTKLVGLDSIALRLRFKVGFSKGAGEAVEVNSILSCSFDMGGEGRVSLGEHDGEECSTICKIAGAPEAMEFSTGRGQLEPPSITRDPVASRGICT